MNNTHCNQLVRWQDESLHLFNQNLFETYPDLYTIFMQIGNTSLQKIQTPSNSSIPLFAKLEYENKWGTIKDRVAFALIYDFINKNKLHKELTVLEYTGGSLGLALSEICSILRIPLEIVVADYVSTDFIEKMKSRKVRVHTVPKKFGFWGVMSQAFELAKNPNLHLLYQHENPINPWIHEISTATELINQLRFNGITQTETIYLVASVGTGGSLNGLLQGLKKNNFNVKLVLTSPKELPYGSTEPPNGLPKFAGSGGLGEGRKQTFIQDVEQSIDSHYEYTYEEALKGCHTYFIENQIKIGSSSGANYLASLEIVNKIKSGVVVTLFPSLAEPHETKNWCN